MAENSGMAGFFGGAGMPENDKKPESPKEAPPPPPAPAPGASAGFLGGAAAPPPPPQPAPPPPPTPEPHAAQPEPAPAAPTLEPEPVVEAPAPVAPEPVKMEQPPEPLPPVTASAAELFSYAEKMYDGGFLDTAITAYRRGLEKDPKNIVSINNLAMAFIERERYADGRDELERAIARGAEDGEIFANLGYCLRKLGKDHDAADAYDSYVNISPDAEDAEPIRGWIAQVRSTPRPDAEEAAPALAAQPSVEAPPPISGGISLAPVDDMPAPPAAAAGGENAAAVLVQAVQAYEAGDFAHALELYNQAQDIDFESVAALAGRGKCQAKLGDMEEARASLQEAISLCPDDAETMFVLGFTLRALDRNNEAAEVFGKFLALRPDDTNAEKIRAWITEIKGGREEDDGKLKIDKQPAWAQAIEGPPEGYGDAGMPNTEAVVAAEEPAPAPMFAAAVPPPIAQDSPSAEQPEPAPPPEQVPAFQPRQPEAPTPPLEPEGVDDAAAESELDRIRELLSTGDSAGALAKAQALVGKSPKLTGAKILIARAFGQQGEFAKAMAILTNIVATEETDEALFFLGRCQQELGKKKEAIASYERCIAISKDDTLKERISTILKELTTAKKEVCGACGESVPGSQLKEVDGQRICTICREKMEEALGGHSAIATEEAANEHPVTEKKKKSAKPKPKKGGPVKTLMVVVFLMLILAGGALATTFKLKPELYQEITDTLPRVLRNILPIADLPLPDYVPDPDQPVPDPGTTVAEDPSDETPDPKTPSPSSELVISSPALGEVIAGVEIEHTVKVDGAEGKDITFEADFSRKPGENYSFDKKTGTLRWRPDREGEPLTITFTAVVGKTKSLPQACTVKIRPGPRVESLGATVPVLPGEAVAMAAGD